MVSFLSLHLGTILQTTNNNVVIKKLIANKRRKKGGTERGLKRMRTRFSPIASVFRTPLFNSLLLMAVVLGLQVVEEPTGRPFQVVEEPAGRPFQVVEEPAGRPFQVVEEPAGRPFQVVES
jgi:hypothetical protein